MIKKIFISYYRMFLGAEDSTPIFAAVNMVVLVLVVLFFLCLILINKFFSYKVYDIRGFGYLYALGHLAFIVILYRFFKNQETKKMLLQFEASTDLNKAIWSAISLLLLVLPILSIIILLTK